MTTDLAATTVRKRSVHTLPSGKQVEIRALGLNDYVQARGEALKRYKRQRIETYTENVDLLPEDQRAGFIREAFERAEQFGQEELPSKEMTLPIRLPTGKFRRDKRGGLVTKKQTVDYTAWWMSETPEGRLFMTWLSIRRSDPTFTLEDADDIFREHMEELEMIADEVGEISSPELGNSAAPPSLDGPTGAKPETARQRRKRRRRRRQTGH